MSTLVFSYYLCLFTVSPISQMFRHYPISSNPVLPSLHLSVRLYVCMANPRQAWGSCWHRWHRWHRWHHSRSQNPVSNSFFRIILVIGQWPSPNMTSSTWWFNANPSTKPHPRSQVAGRRSQGSRPRPTVAGNINCNSDSDSDSNSISNSISNSNYGQQYQ